MCQSKLKLTKPSELFATLRDASTETVAVVLKGGGDGGAGGVGGIGAGGGFWLLAMAKHRPVWLDRSVPS